MYTRKLADIYVCRYVGMYVGMYIYMHYMYVYQSLHVYIHYIYICIRDEAELMTLVYSLCLSNLFIFQPSIAFDSLELSDKIDPPRYI